MDFIWLSEEVVPEATVVEIVAKTKLNIDMSVIDREDNIV